jgi:hypothetical protein
MRRPDENTLVGENSLRGLCNLLAEVRTMVDTTLAKAEDRTQGRLAEMHQDEARNGKPLATLS